MDQFIDIVTSGFLVGVLISAPMGPIGMLCIQRTLNNGRRSGLMTGVGASLSDFFYCLLTGLGLTFIEDFLDRNRAAITIFGSILIIAFAVYLFRKNPAGALRSPDGTDHAKESSRWSDFVTGFLFTFSNPLILFFIIGLFTRFSFLSEEFTFYHYIAGYSSIIGGALVWWWLITFFVNKVRSHFNVRSMWLINRIIAVILVIMACAGLFISIRKFIS